MECYFKVNKTERKSMRDGRESGRKREGRGMGRRWSDSSGKEEDEEQHRKSMRGMGGRNERTK